MVRALIVDDEPHSRRALACLLREYGIPSASAATAAEALGVVQRARIDAAFLDVRLPEVDGLVLGERLTRNGVPVIFVTGFPDYALAAYDVGAADYLVKPVTVDRLGRALARLRWPGSGSAVERPVGAGAGATGSFSTPVERLCLHTEGGRVLLPPTAVLYARRDGPATTLVLAEGEALRLLLSLDSLDRALRGRGFFRSHRAFLVNLRHVRRIVPWSRDARSLLLDDAKETLVPLAKSRMQELRAYLIWP